jgi:antibiotic biosynthesis monooxygenase (ABM) superfamily enzyme
MPWNSGNSGRGLLRLFARRAGVTAPAPPARERRIWDIAIGVLGLNIWVSFLLVPVLHLEEPGPGAGVVLLLLAALSCLAVGVWRRHSLLLLVVYPLLLLLTTITNPQLVGVNVYTPWTFVLVAASLLAYLLATPLFLGLSAAPQLPDETRDLEQFPYTPKWRRRMRVYRGLAALAGVFPAVLVATLFLHPGVKADLTRSYPGRLTETLALFGVLVLMLWLGLFHTYFLTPLRAHIRGDPQVRYELQNLRRQLHRRRVRPSFYAFVAVALILMMVLVLVHW